MSAPAAPAQARWAVLGATGQIGHFLIQRLERAGEPALALSRHAPEGGVERGSIRWLRGDLDREMPSLEVEHMLSAGPLDACARWLGDSAHLVQCRELVAFSSTSVGTKADSGDAGERELAARLARAETELERACARRGIALLVLRPTLVYGCGRDRNLTRLAQAARRLGVLPLPRSCDGLRQPVHADDLAALALSARSATDIRAFDLGGGETLSFRVMVERVLACLPGTPKALPIPDPLFRLLNGGVRMLRRGAGLNPAQVRRMAHDLVCDDAAARRELAWDPRPFLPEPGMFEPPAGGV